MSGTAIIHDATLTPGKLDLLATWLPKQPWFHGDATDLERVGSYRFVDPDDEVGIETILVRSAGVVYQVPVTYRAAPLTDADAHLIGTMEHSVLGTRWVYDGPGDPMYVTELIRVIREGDTEADLSLGEKTATVEGSGVVPGVDLAGQARIARVIDEEGFSEHARGLLTGTWTQDGRTRVAVLACLK